VKITFANGRRTYPLFNGGDGISFHEILDQLYKDGNRVRAIGKINNQDFKETAHQVIIKLTETSLKPKVCKKTLIEYSQDNGYTCKLFSDETVTGQLKDELITNKPDILITQLNYSHKVIDLASTLKIPTILFIHDHHPFNFLPINTSKKIAHVVFNSKNTSSHYKNLLKCDSSVIYPGIKFENYICKENSREFVTCINPIEDKGGKILKEIIPKLEQTSFLLVKNWKDIDKSFYNMKNVTVYERQYDMRNVYSKTKILLVPSQWEESFARIIPEAMINRIPVIASNVGGLKESVGKGGILIDNFVSPEVWSNEITSLLSNKKTYEAIFKQARDAALRYKFQNAYVKLIKLFNRIYSSRKVQ